MNEIFVSKLGRRILGQPCTIQVYNVSGYYPAVLGASAIDIKYADLSTPNGIWVGASSQPYFQFFYGYLNFTLTFNSGAGTYVYSISYNVPQTGAFPGGLYEVSGCNVPFSATNLLPLSNGNFTKTFPVPVTFISIVSSFQTSAASSLDASVNYTFSGYKVFATR